MSMWISIISMTAFLSTGVYMLVWANFSTTRRVAMIPLFMTVAELVMFGSLSVIANPTAILLLLAVRVFILAICYRAVQADRKAAKARRRNRERFHTEWQRAVEPLYVIRRKRAAAQIDIAA